MSHFRPVFTAVFVTLFVSISPASAQDQPLWTEYGLVFPEGARIPAYMTEVEREYLLVNPPTPEPLRLVPPTGSIYCVPEYAPMEGLLMAWEGYTDVLTAMSVGITSGDPQAKVFMVVDNTTEQNSVYTTLSNAGCDMTRVVFLVRVTDTVWIRDYGPRYIYQDGQRAIIDHTYNRPRPNDNALNDWLAPYWSQAQYDIPLTHGGGNFHLFGNGDAFMSTLILTENPGKTEQQIKDLYSQYQNVDLTIYPGFPTSFDSTQHIDMWMLAVDDYKVIIGQYASGTGQPYTITENAVANLVSRGYAVYRTPGWNTSGTHYTYTNSVILNGQVFIPRFGGSYTTQDNQAKAVFQQAFPDKTIRQIDCSSIIHAAGAIHCIVMHVPVPSTGLVVTPSDDLVASGPAGGPFTPASMTYTLRNQGNQPLAYEVTKTADWLSIANASGTIPSQGNAVVTVLFNTNSEALGHGLHEDVIQFVNLTNHDGDTTRNVALDVDALAVQYRFSLDADPGWTCEGAWAFGQPSGGGSHNGDPSAGATGANVYGYNLAGDYTNNMPVYALTTTPIDCRDLTDVELRFQRWLGVERNAFDHAGLYASNDGSNWTLIWENPNTTISEAAWAQVTYNISDVADGQPAVYLRWTMGPTDGSTTYPGWNIDDVEIWGIETGVPCPGDLDGDLDVDIADLAMLLAHYGNTGASPEDGDLDGDGDVDLADLAALLAVYGTVCP